MPKRLQEFTETDFAALHELRSFRAWFGLTNKELARMFIRAESTIKAKVTGRERITVLRGWICDKVDLLEQNRRPFGWPDDLPPRALRHLNPYRRQRIAKARRNVSGLKSYSPDPLRP